MVDRADFEWDDAKRLQNIVKHGIDFRAIVAAFEDPAAMRIRSPKPQQEEERWILLARYRGFVLFIVYTLRGERTRIISARVANQKERSIYGLG
jgi:uncharacterized DUF497 family protein